MFLSIHKSEVLIWNEVLGKCEIHAHKVTQSIKKDENSPVFFIKLVLWLGIIQIIKEEIISNKVSCINIK